MSYRPLLAMVVLLTMACVANDPADDLSKRLHTASTTNLEPDDDSHKTAPLEVFAEVGEMLGERVDELALFGYRGRPLAEAEKALIPNLGIRYPGLSIKQRSLFWGIDSSAILLSVDGDPEMVKEAAAWLGPSTTWILAGQRWLAALFPGDGTAAFEMRTLLETVFWVMNPDEACQRSLEACPLGPTFGYPPPPPTLVVNGETKTEPEALGLISLVGTSNVAAGGGTISWISDGQAYTGLGGGGEKQLLEAPTRGAALSAVSFGHLVFLVDPTGSSKGGPAVVARPCCHQADVAVWPIPDGWRVNGLAVAGHFGHQNLRLLITAEQSTGEGHAVVVEFDDELAAGETVSPDVDLSELGAVNPAGTRWSEPRRGNDGLIVVVQENNNDWLLVGDALGEPVQMARSSERIVGHAVSAGRHDVVLITEAEPGADPRMWWSHDGELTEFESEATSVAWYGSWLR